MKPAEAYLAKAREIIACVSGQITAIEQAADWFAEAILAGRMVHVFGTGQCRAMVEEFWPRNGSFPGFHTIVELALSAPNPVGANGPRQAMYLENTPGLAEQIFKNYALHRKDAALIITSSGCSVVPVEMAALFQQRGIRVVALVSVRHSAVSASRHPEGRKVQDFADLVLDTGAPTGDALISVEGIEEPVGSASTLGGCLVINCLKVEVARRLARAGHPPKVLVAPALAGPERAGSLFELAVAEQARLLAKLHQDLEAQTESVTSFRRRTPEKPAEELDTGSFFIT